MTRIASAIAAAALALAGGLVVAAPAHALPRCLFDGDWNCQRPPQYNGPGLNTWDVPGTYGGWTTLPLICDPGTGGCRQYVTP